MHFGDISSLWGYIDFTVMKTAQTITNVRKVEMNESKLLPNCGQFYTFFPFDKTEKNIRVR